MKREKSIKYYRIARFIANELSRDPNTKVGCLFLAPESLEIRGLGYNGMPRNINETPERWARPTKYDWVSHSEINAITNCARSGTNTNGSIAVITMYPCVTCCKALLQAGIKEIITMKPNLNDPKWGEEFKISQEMLDELAIKVTFLDESEVN